MSDLNFTEELALEKFALILHEERADLFWREGSYAESLKERCEAQAARIYIAELEAGA